MRREGINHVRMVKEMKMEGHRLPGKPRKSWRSYVRQDMEKVGLGKDLILTRSVMHNPSIMGMKGHTMVITTIFKKDN